MARLNQLPEPTVRESCVGSDDNMMRAVCNMLLIPASRGPAMPDR